MHSTQHKQLHPCFICLCSAYCVLASHNSLVASASEALPSDKVVAKHRVQTDGPISEGSSTCKAISKAIVSQATQATREFTNKQFIDAEHGLLVNQNNTRIFFLFSLILR